MMMMMMMMEWENQQQQQNESVMNGVNMYVKVMNDEQLETLRKQIAVYASICEHLVEMHKNLTAHQDLAATGGRLGNLYCDCDPLMIMTCGGGGSGRQRWTPTAVQLQILERIFDKGSGTGTPSKQKIKEITSQLSQHGLISETNVYNWFQNRRARSKRKQLVLVASNQNKPQDLCFNNPEITSDSELHLLGVLSNPIPNGDSGKMGMPLPLPLPGSYSIYEEEEDCSMALAVAWEGMG